MTPGLAARERERLVEERIERDRAVGSGEQRLRTFARMSHDAHAELVSANRSAAINPVALGVEDFHRAGNAVRRPQRRAAVFVERVNRTDVKERVFLDGDLGFFLWRAQLGADINAIGGCTGTHPVSPAFAEDYIASGVHPFDLDIEDAHAVAFDPVHLAREDATSAGAVVVKVDAIDEAVCNPAAFVMGEVMRALLAYRKSSGCVERMNARPFHGEIERVTVRHARVETKHRTPVRENLVPPVESLLLRLELQRWHGRRITSRTRTGNNILAVCFLRPLL